MTDTSSCSLPDNTVYSDYLTANLSSEKDFPALPTIQTGQMKISKARLSHKKAGVHWNTESQNEISAQFQCI